MVQLTNLKDFKAATVEDIQAIHSPAYSRGLEQWMIKHEKGHVENETTYFRANTLQDSLRVPLHCHATTMLLTLDHSQSSKIDEE